MTLRSTAMLLQLGLLVMLAVCVPGSAQAGPLDGSVCDDLGLERPLRSQCVAYCDGRACTTDGDRAFMPECERRLRRYLKSTDGELPPCETVPRLCRLRCRRPAWTAQKECRRRAAEALAECPPADSECEAEVAAHLENCLKRSRELHADCVSECLSDDICVLPKDPGPCDALIPRWFFDSESGRCERFVWGGCGGNANNFLTRERCELACGSPDRCRLPSDPGPCDAAIPRWFFDSEAGVCRKFVYGGCGGNLNNFESLEECTRACGGDPCGQTVCLPHQECLIYEPTGEAYCADTCKGFPCPLGTHCRLVEVNCVRAPCPPVATCVADDPVCGLPPDPGPCDAAILRWFFNADTGRCEQFVWGGCGGNANNFESLAECRASCLSCEADPCALPAEVGSCTAAIPRWFFNGGTGACEQFIWGGCGGNANNFETEEACQAQCAAPLLR